MGKVLKNKESENGPNTVLGIGCRRGDVYCMRSSSFGRFVDDIGGCAAGEVIVGFTIRHSDDQAIALVHQDAC